MKKVSVLLAFLWLLTSCSNQPEKPGISASDTEKTHTDKSTSEEKGIGPVTNVTLNTPLLAPMVEKGKAIYETKCASCHKLSDERLVGPGWKGITERRKPEWIMNMTTNVQEMLKKDSTAIALLRECGVAMSEQQLSPNEARYVLEFIYANDGYEVGEL